IPDTIPVTASTGILNNSATLDQRFWKDYIDFVLAAGRYLDNNILAGVNANNSNTRRGANLHYNSPSTSALSPKITPPDNLGTATGGFNVRDMRYDDNPIHPRQPCWFGAQTRLSYLQTRYFWSGTCYEAPCWQLKVGIKAAIHDIKNNHPNDLAALMFFS